MNIITAANKNKQAVTSDGKSFNFGALQARIDQILKALQQKGLVSGHRIAIQLPNGIDFLLSYLACLQGGLSAVPINLSLPKNTIDYILQSVRPNLTINRPLAQVNELKLSHSTKADDKPLCIFYTSGTTSLPKGVCHYFETFIHNAKAFNELMGVDASIRMLHVLPMGYMAGFLNTIICPLVAGGSVVIAPQLQAATATKFWDEAQKHNINAVWLTPTMLALLTKLSRDEATFVWARKNLKNIFVGTAPLPVVVKKEFEDKFQVECWESYGLSEAMLVSGNSPQYSRKPKSVGRLISGVSMAAFEENGKQIKSEGDLKIKSDYLLAGYFNPEKNTFDPEKSEWFNTGDYGYSDKDGDLFITGRKKDIIIHGGTNVSPRNVEEVLLAYAEVKDAAVVGEPHPFWGEEVVAFIIPKEGKAIALEGLKKYCKENLHPDAIPGKFQFCEEFPRSSTGKVQKNILKQSLANPAKAA